MQRFMFASLFLSNRYRSSKRNFTVEERDESDLEKY